MTQLFTDPCAALQRGHPLAQGLLGLWIPSIGAGGSVPEYTGHSPAAALDNTAAWNTADPIGYSINFPGSGFPRLDVNNVSWVLNSCTVAFWVKTAADGQGFINLGDSNAVAIVSGDLSTGHSAYLNTASGKVALTFNADEQVLESATSVNDGAWHFVVCVRDFQNAEARIYIDGQRDAVDTLTDTSTLTLTSALFGAFQESGVSADYNLTGDMGAVYLWDIPFDDAAVAALYSRPYAMFDRRGRDFIVLVSLALPAPSTGPGLPDPEEPGGEGPPTEPENIVSTALPFGTEYGLVCMLDDGYKRDGWSHRGTIVGIDETASESVIRLTVSGVTWVGGAAYDGLWALITSGASEDVWFQIDSVDPENHYIYLAGLSLGDVSFTAGDQFDIGAVAAYRDFSVFRPAGSVQFRAAQVDHEGASGDNDNESLAELYLDSFGEDLGPGTLSRSGRTRIDTAAREGHPWRRLQYDADSIGDVSPRSSRFRFRLRALVRNAAIKVRQVRLLGKTWRR